MKRFGGYLIVGLISAASVLALSKKFGDHTYVNYGQAQSIGKLANYNPMGGGLEPDAFIVAAAKSTPAVVHIKVTTEIKQTKQRQSYNPFFDFFGDGNPYQQGPEVGTGSGVIIASDGYIVTNNHVVEDADEIEVSLSDNKVYKAKLIGRDPSTDIAVVKIEESNLPFLTFDNSDNVQVGQWVLAVGNPFDLASTVTAGIVSAKGRNINIIRQTAGNYAVESFIQTDAAVNPGNSGGALVNLDGNLVGINAAIATPTGTYAGYSFAIPSNLVQKIVKDIMDYGVVQRGYLGVNIGELTPDLAKKINYSKMEGAYVSDIVSGSGAEEAGIKSGDVIVKVDGLTIKSSPELQEHVARFKPGDKILVDIIRDGKMIEKEVQLKNKDNGVALMSKEEVEKSSSALVSLGAKFEALDATDAQKLGLRGGIKVTEVGNGVLSENTDIQPGFIITRLNNATVTNLKDFESLLNQNRGNGVLIEGRYPNKNGIKYYAFGY